MPELRGEGFPAFFEQVTEHEPFEWQAELVDQLLRRRFPDVVDVPTGLGKTALILCWTYALAAGAAVPRRLCFVVDRRLVVDSAHDDARSLADQLSRSTPGTYAGEVAARLQAMHGDSELPPLEVVRMRGGVTWESRWLARPDQAAVVVGTVDQVGSRLLFRGYGVSDGMRPVNAALVGMDSWVVIDEAHIAEPLVRTATSVAAYQAMTQSLGKATPLRITKMSATTEASGNIVHADLEKQAASTRFPRSAEAAARRRDARKPSVLIDVRDLASSARGRRHTTAARLGEALADIAIQMDPSAQVVGVIANTIATARAAYDRLTQAGESACLLIGRVRPYEREHVAGEAVRDLMVGQPRPPEGTRRFVVATQTIEVGANLDLDALVTECAPLSSLVQRFGRVNRIGARASHRSAIVQGGFAHGEEDPVYGEATARTWEVLTERGGPVVEVTTGEIRRGVEWPEDLPLDLGLVEARRLVVAAGPAVRVATPWTHRILGSHVERWAATSPAPWPDQSVEPFLHGQGQGTHDVAVAWRVAPPIPADGRLTDDDLREAWTSWLDLVRPVEWEFVDVPIWELHSLLSGRVTHLTTSDLESSSSEQEDPEGEAAGQEGVLGFVYQGPDKPLRPVRGPRDVAIGDRVVLRSDIGGHDRWGWTGQRAKSGEPFVADVADLAPGRTRPRLRLSEDVMKSFVGTTELPQVEGAFRPLTDALKSWAERNPTEPPGRGALVEPRDETLSNLVALEGLRSKPVLGDLLADVLADAMRRAPRWPEVVPIEWTVPSKQGARSNGLFLATTATGLSSIDAVSDEDLLSTSAGPRRQKLRDHGDEVGALARTFAANLELPQHLARAVELAGRWHDLGKAERRFQIMLHEGDEFAADAALEPLAKSGRDPRDSIGRAAWRLSGLPPRFRHEGISGQLVRELFRRSRDLIEGLDAELIHHLVSSHHGFARPVLPPTRDPNSRERRKIEISVEGHDLVLEPEPQLDWTHPERFERLNGSYGWWGLALLETLVRLADMRCSEVRP